MEQKPMHRLLRFWQLAFLVAMLALALLMTLMFIQRHRSPTISKEAEGWRSVGVSTAPTWDGKMLLFCSPEGSLAITALSSDVIRVRFTTEPSFGRDHSYTVVNRDLGKTDASVKIGSHCSTLTTASLQVTIQHNPLRISFADSNGKLLDTDDPLQGIAFAGKSFRVAKQLLEDEHVYGFGEKNGRLDKRGWHLGGYNYVMWNCDTYDYDSSTDPIYASVPFYMVVHQGQAHGLFLDNTWRTSFDVGRQQHNLLIFGAEGGDLNYYFINGPHPKQVVERYTALTGRMPLPPLWSLGYNQCRYSYFPQSRVQWLADTFRAKKIPIDVLWLDIHYQDNYKPFTWDHARFPDPEKMISDLRKQGIRTICIVDPHPKVEKGYAPYDMGMEGEYFVKRVDGSVYEGPVWPSKSEHNPALSVFPDFSCIKARQWWGSLYKSLLDIGVAGIWNDMNEPAVFVEPTGTMPLDVIHDNEGKPTDHREIHNVYGQLMTRSTFEGLTQLRPNERPFVLTRSTFAGGQRYAALWPGDNAADWASFRQSISTLLGMGISGFSFVGCDIGGFAHPVSAELFTRWLQAGVFFPFMRVHAEYGTPDKEPWVFGSAYEAINKRAIELRYELLPTIYQVMQEASETGIPAMRALFLEFPDDKEAASIDDEFLFGSNLIVAPILFEDATEREIYLPKGDWFDYWSGRKYAGNTTINVPASLDSIPIFAREGSFIFRQPVVQSTGEMSGKPLKVRVFPAMDSKGIHYEDDGTSFEYRDQVFLKRHFRQTQTDSMTAIEVSAPEGKYRPAARDLILEVVSHREPLSVSVQVGNGEIALLPRADTLPSWQVGDGVIIIRDEDHLEPVRFVIKY